MIEKETKVTADSESDRDNKKYKSKYYMEIYDDDSESLKEIKMKWNKRIDEIKRD